MPSHSRIVALQLLLLTAVVKPQQSWRCLNDCVCASDGTCSDGGAGSEFSTCEYGRDCDDCGTRCSCDNVKVSSTEAYVNELAIGVYTVTSERTFARWVYQNANGWRMFYNASSWSWQLKPSADSAAEPLVKSGRTWRLPLCPPEGPWLAWNGSTWISEVHVACNVSTPLLIPPLPRDPWWVQTSAGPIYVIVGVGLYITLEILVSIQQTFAARENSKGRWMIPPSWRSTVIRLFVLRALLITIFLLPVPVSLAWQIQEVSLFVWQDGKVIADPSAMPVVGACTAVVAMLILWPLDLSVRRRKRNDLSKRIACVEQPIPPMDLNASQNQSLPEQPMVSNLGLTALLKSGTIMLVSVRWLLSQPVDFKIKRRQDLPVDAFVAPALAVTMLEAGDIVALSYRWLHSDHPDPSGWHLQRVRSFLSRCPHWKALLMDYASLPQKKGPTGERSPEEQAMFKAGLQGMGMVYATPRIAVLQDKGLPNDMQGVRTYSESGWCTFEEAAASLATRSGGYIHNVDVDHGRVLLDSDQALSRSRHAGVMADLRNENRTHFFGAADREQVAYMYKSLLERIEALEDELCGNDLLLMDESLTWRLRHIFVHLLVMGALGLVGYCFCWMALALPELDLSIKITAAISASMNLLLGYGRIFLFGSPCFVEHFKQVMAQTPLDSRHYVCMPFLFHGWLFGKPFLMHRSVFRSKLNQVVSYHSASASASSEVLEMAMPVPIPMRVEGVT